ncbi:hypothetical protein [Legionella pneumophila]|uniref:hypothetical protein n=1 Tax=Legionella pneumophila TaxID=446 RepID=UPI001374A453|nr:hypothetical protein [Legionella pneumophila]
MSDSVGKLKTPKFKKFRGKLGEYLKEPSALPIKHGLELAIKQIKRSDIVVSRNQCQNYGKLFDDAKRRKNYLYTSDLMLFRGILYYVLEKCPRIWERP